MTKRIYIHVAGNTLDSHQKFIKKLKKKGAKVVTTKDNSDASIVFCPIVSRFETDIKSALSSAKDAGCRNIIVVAMHHTFDKEYTLPNHRELGYEDVNLLVDCLFFEKQGLLKCPCNKKAVKAVRKKLGLSKLPSF